jgi:hypothetical protein
MNDAFRTAGLRLEQPPYGDQALPIGKTLVLHEDAGWLLLDSGPDQVTMQCGTAADPLTNERDKIAERWTVGIAKGERNYPMIGHRFRLRHQ